MTFFLNSVTHSYYYFIAFYDIQMTSSLDRIATIEEITLIFFSSFFLVFCASAAFQ